MATMDTDDFLNCNLPIPQKLVENKKNKKRKRSEDRQLPQTTEDLSEDDFAKPTQNDLVKRMKYTSFVIPKDLNQNQISGIKVEPDQ